ncbi:hemolysin III [Deinobacterium chartae]|uniref:Hemolysin III n=1 Tax=Deinobacterium chartae TaxID=521158 RepID=A0A841HVC3_9DEIO|nr:hemolysin III family protein [Deinobacterium chartae]MBB6097327.1 hemolysin III [Deinobacterium chartae]
MKTLWNALREPINSLTHWFGALAALILMGVLVYAAVQAQVQAWPFVVFGVSMCLLYVASASYHSFRVSDRALLWLRKLDHSAIFLLIAGSYTPVLIFAVKGGWQVGMLCAVWGIALAGIILKLVTMRLPRWISTVLYLAMGWMAVLILPQLLATLSVGALTWLLVGGLLYTAGAVIYATKRGNFFPGVFGFHELWHVFVLGGSGAHFAMMLNLLPRAH